MQLVSFIMSSYNDEQYVDRCLDSLVKQSYKNWELIVVDDCSSDGTLKKLVAWSQLDNRIKVLESEKKSCLAANLNTAIGMAKGDFIARMDTDDECMPERLNEQVQFMNKNPLIDILGTSYVEIDGKKSTFTSMPQLDSEIKERGFLKSMFCHPTVMFRPAILSLLGGYDAKLLRAQDKDLWLRAVARGAKFHNLQQPLLKYYRYPKSHSFKNTVNKFQANLAISMKQRNIQFAFLTFLRFSLDVSYEHIKSLFNRIRISR
jgi:glycosyltransferase EpsE